MALELNLDNLLRSMLANGLMNFGLACCEEIGEFVKVFACGKVVVMVPADTLLTLSLRLTFTCDFESAELPPSLAVALSIFDESPF